MWRQLNIPIFGILICASLLALLELIPDEFKSQPLVNETRLSSTSYNIMLITIDSLRADYLELYGHSTSTAPFLSNFMKRGAVFDRAIAPAYLTFQTDASIFTGLYPSQHGMLTWVTPIRDNLTLLQKVLETRGYTSHAFVSPSLYQYFKLFDGFTSYSMAPKPKSLLHNRELVLSHLASTTSHAPFFIFWHIYDVHLPYYPTLFVGYNGPFANSNALFQWENQSSTSVMMRRPSEGHVPISNIDSAYLRAAYENGIRFVDTELERFFSIFAENHPDIYAKTVFIITAEHGDDLKEHGFIFHRDLYDVNTHVPLAIINEHLLQPQRYTQSVSLLDLYPTILDIAGVNITQARESESLLPRLQNSQDRPTDQLIYSERQPFDEIAVWKGQWKFILRNPDMRTYKPINNGDKNDRISADDFFVKIRNFDIARTDELYNISTDRYEQHNLVGTGLPIEHELRDAATAFKLRMQGERAQYTRDMSDDPSIPLTYP